MDLRRKLTQTAEHFRPGIDPEAIEGREVPRPMDPATQPVLLGKATTQPVFHDGHMVFTTWECLAMGGADIRNFDILRILGEAYRVVAVVPVWKKGVELVRQLKLTTLSKQDAEELP